MRKRTRPATSSFAFPWVQFTLCAFCDIGLVAFVFLIACSQMPPQVSKSASSGGWQEFYGTWTAAGSRNRMRLGENRWAAISTYDGSLLLSGPSRPGIGFRSEAIVFSDTATGLIGRAVWTDEHGDQIVSELQSGGSTENNKIAGTFVGGTGRYAGATGAYEFSWRFVIENEDGIVQGQSIHLHGRVRVDSSHLASMLQGPQS